MFSQKVNKFFSFIGLASIFFLNFSELAFAESWPSKTVRIIVPTGAGSAPDVVARLLGEKLSIKWKQGVVIENRPGAGGIPGMSTLARATPDGYTIGFVPAAMGTITPLVFKNPQFSPEQLVPVATIGTSPLLIVTPTSSGIKNLSDLKSQGQSNPGKVNFAAAQLNSLPHMAGELMNKRGDMKLFTVPYPNPPAAINATLAGDAVVTADGIPSLVPHIKAGTLKALAVTSHQRVPGFENIPSVSEFLPGFEALGWFQIVVPKGTNSSIVNIVNKDINEITGTTDVAIRLNDLGIFPQQHSVREAQIFFESQKKYMTEIVSELDIQPN